MSCDDPRGFPIRSDRQPHQELFFTKDYPGWESLQDWDRDLSEALDDLPVNGEFTGTIRVTMTYIRDEAE